MNGKWMPTTAGILGFISAAFQLAVAIFVFYFFAFVREWWSDSSVWIIRSVLSSSVPFTLTGILTALGGVYSLKRKGWGLALAGAITAYFGALFAYFVSVFIIMDEVSSIFFFIAFPFGAMVVMCAGIGALVLTVLANKEFEEESVRVEAVP